MMFQFQTVTRVRAAESWLAGWQYRKSEVINPASGAGTNYQVRIKAIWGEITSEDLAPSAEIVSTLPIPTGTSIICAQAAVYWDGAYLHVWYPATTGGDINDSIYYTKASSPFTNWDTPIKVIDRDDGIRDPTIFLEGNNIYLFCQCWNGSDYRPIRLYKIANTADFTNSDNYAYVGVVLDVGGSGDYDEYMAASPCVVKIGDTYYLAYEAGGNEGYSIGRAKTTNIESLPWTKDGQMRDTEGNVIRTTVNPQDPIVPDTFINENTLTLHYYNESTDTWSDRYLYGDVPSNALTMSGDVNPDDGYASHANYAHIGYLGGVYYFLMQSWDPSPIELRLYKVQENIVALHSHAKTDFGDVRFTDDDGVTPLDYWMEEKSDGKYAVFWVKVADDLSTNPATIYMYYGNPSASTTSNIKATSLWGQGDDFNDNSRDTNIWDEHKLGTGIPSETNQRLEFYVPYAGDRAGYVSKDSQYINNCEIFVTMRQTIVTELDLYIHTQKTTNNEPYFYDDWYRVLLWTWQGGYGFYAQKRVSGSVADLYVGSQLTTHEKLKIQVTDGTVRFFEQNTLRATDTYSLSTRNCYIYIVARAHSSVNGTDFFDNVFTRKLVDPEPAHGSWGSEETVPPPPSFGSIIANTTVAGSPVQLSCQVNSAANVSYYIYSWNNTGSWTNQTATPFTNFVNSSAAYATFAGTWNTAAGNRVSAKVYANDTYNNWNTSSQYNFTITPASASKLLITAGAGQSLSVGQLSGQVTVQRQDQYGNPVTSGSTTVNLTSSSLGATFYSDAGNTPAASVTISNGASTVGFWYNDTVVGSPVLTVSASGLTSTTTIFAITSTSIDHFTITAVSSPQTAGSAFSITVTAVDQYGNTVTGYTGQNTLSDLSGTISPAGTTSFSGGVWTGSVTITKAYQSDTISTLGSGKSGTTNSFDVKPSALDHFTISGYPSSTITGQSFNITATTWDAYGNIATGYAGQVYFTSSDGRAVLPYTSGNKYTFTSGDNGSRTFTGFQLNTAPSQTITVTDGVKSAISNLITVMLPITPPTYSNILVSSTTAGQQCTFSSQWNDNYGLSGYIFSTNNTGLWQNTTWTPLLSTPSWASVTQNLNNNIGTVIAYIWYANNTNGLWNNTGIQTLTTTDSGFGLSPFSIVSNSTISELAFNSTSQVLEFTVSGPSGTTGYTNITISKTLIADISGLTVYFDANEIQYVNSSTQFNWFLYFTYHHSTHKVIVAMKSTAQPSQASDFNSVLLSAAFIASIFGASMMIWRRLRIKRLTRDANRTVHSASAS
jgi:hypothetical protein